MNWVLMVAVIILVLCAINGYCKGIVRMIYSLIAWILILAFVTWATPYINQYLRDHTKVYEKVLETCELTVQEKAQEKLETQMEANTDASESNLDDLGIEIPGGILERISSNITDTTGQLLESSGVYDAVAVGIADFIMKAISFVGALLIGIIVSGLIFQLINIINDIPVVGGMNRVAGILAGGCCGILVIWIWFAILATMAASGGAGRAISHIYENPFLSFLYENNLVLFLIAIYL